MVLEKPHQEISIKNSNKENSNKYNLTIMMWKCFHHNFYNLKLWKSLSEIILRYYQKQVKNLWKLKMIPLTKTPFPIIWLFLLLILWNTLETLSIKHKKYNTPSLVSIPHKISNQHTNLFSKIKHPIWIKIQI